MIPPLLCLTASKRLTKTRSKRGRNFVATDACPETKLIILQHGFNHWERLTIIIDNSMQIRVWEAHDGTA